MDKTSTHHKLLSASATFSPQVGSLELENASFKVHPLYSYHKCKKLFYIYTLKLSSVIL